MLALFLGLVVSAGLYFAYMWPSVEPVDGEPVVAAGDSPATTTTEDAAVAEPVASVAAEPDSSTDASKDADA